MDAPSGRGTSGARRNVSQSPTSGALRATFGAINVTRRGLATCTWPEIKRLAPYVMIWSLGNEPTSKVEIVQLP